MNKKGIVDFFDFDFIMFLIGIVVIIGIGLLIYFSIILNSIGEADGHHTGIVTAVGYESGIFYGSDVAYFKTNTESSQEDVYCIENAYLKEILEGYAKEKKEATIHYKNQRWMWNKECYKGVSIIVGVEGD